MAANWFSAPAPVARRARAYFAPVNRAAQTPVLFDPSEQGRFSLDAPPAPWIGLGWIQNFVRKPASKTAPVLTGIPAATLEQVRETIQAQVSLQFLSWTKLTMALATGSQHMNLLAAAADGAQASPAVVPQSGSTATSILLASADAAKFSPGSIVALDVDYTGQIGFVGTPVAGAYLRQAVTDVDYIRRITFNVALVSQVISSGLTLAEALPGGAPAAGARLQALTGFVDREGGSFYQEWSALFVLEGSQAERIFFYYPRLQTMTGAEESTLPLNGKNPNGQSRVLLKGQFLALPVTDPWMASAWYVTEASCPRPTRSCNTGITPRVGNQRVNMKITIQGQDYTAALDAVHPVTIERKLNEPSICQLWLSLAASGSLAAPSRYQSLTMTGDDGTPYFTGYIAVSPLPEYSGMGLEGPRYRTAIQAVSDELLLDQLLMPPSAGTANVTAGALLTSRVIHSGSAALSTLGLTLNTAIGSFVPDRGANWSKSAGQAASMARAAYRALNGAITLTSVQSTVHPLNETDGSLTLASLDFTASVKRALANDVTVCGEDEPVAYVTEYFLGDGVTTQFYLAADPYFLTASKSTIISELFNEPQINQSLWGVSGGAGYLTLGARGLAINGGNGIDGQTLLSWLDPVEMGGVLLLEAVGVTLSSGSTGILAGFFSGLDIVSGCTAGFQAAAQQGTGAVTLQPIIEGTAAGTTFAVNSANQYTLRVRVYCPECERAQTIYYSFGNSGAIAAGGEWVLGPGKIQMEIQEFVNGVGATPVTLYDGAITNLPGTCTLVAASSINLIGAMRAVNLTNLGSGWVVSTPPGGGPYTRRVGTTAEAAECHLERTGKIAFYTGYVPVSGEQIAVNYRTVGRAVGRAVNASSQQALAQAGSPSVAAWIGSVTNPPARSSADCRNAALVMEQAAASVSALWSGTYKGTRASFAADVWPGDALLLNAPSSNLNAQVVVRTVKVSYSASYPDLVEYDIAFANDWADDLAIKTSATVPVNTWLPAPVAPTVLQNLNSLTVTALNGSTVTINTGVTPPTGGGFEIRLRDFYFMPGEDPTLVLRGSQTTLTFSRVSASDRFYIRMYDGSTPPNYSEFSTALFINLPLSS